MPASARAVLSEDDLIILAGRLDINPDRLVIFLKSEASLAYLKVSDLKVIINFLKDRGKHHLRLTGNKGDLTHRIGSVLFGDGGGTPSEDTTRTQTTLTYPPNPFYLSCQTFKVGHFSYF